MPLSPNRATQKRQFNTQLSKLKNKPAQHGYLLDIPTEILSAITANLDPKSLLSLGESHINLANHIEEESTWRGAFEAHYGTDLLFRSTGPTWRKEFSDRYTLLERFAHSNVASTTYSPLPSPAISRIHLLPPSAGVPGLLSLSLTYGIIARTIPDTGKTLPGYIDASGSTMGRGLGNPNAEFVPDVSSCAISTVGGTVHILWGYRSGHIAYMVTNRTMEKTRRAAAEFRVTQDNEMHWGPVLDVAWVNDNERYAVSGGSNGAIKLWDFTLNSTPDLLWTSTDPPAAPVDACIKVVANRALGLIVGVRRSGAVNIWRGFNFPSVVGVQQTVVSDFPSRRNTDTNTVLALHIDPFTASILVAFHGDVCFYRINWKAEEEPTITAYGAPEGGGILTSLLPCFSGGPDTKSFVFTGDKLGGINAYEWAPEVPTPRDVVTGPARSFQASSPPPNPVVTGRSSKAKGPPPQHKQESITALAWTPSILVSGTSAGVVVAWDSLTFERVRVIVRAASLRRTRRRMGFAAEGQDDDANTEAISDAVKQILIGEGGDSVFVNVGGEVITWRAGDVVSGASSTGSTLRVGKTSSSGKSRKSTPRKELAGTSGKWTEQWELKRNIFESRSLYKDIRDEAEKSNQGARRQRENNERAHQKLGLSESEALEYALMLSREAGPVPTSDPEVQEEDGTGEARATALGTNDALTDEQIQAAMESGFFSLDEDTTTATGASTPTPSPRLPRDPEDEFPSFTSPLRRAVSETSTGPSPISSSPVDGSEGSSPITHPASLVTRMRRRESIGSAVSSLSDLSVKSGGSGGSNKSRGSSGSENAWGKPLGDAVRTPPRVSRGGSAGPSWGGAVGGSAVWDEMDDDLRFALELSLAEARSKGEST